ncbi:hypothetical protein H1S01_19955 [Heliobacterium chlorum]|uniref:Uncharacterized protein n=1 Tax=Heliobacterium chlorum TaxID=2698 RepID=A0ABR7T7I5_HELCL|nr:hypothetical protein [Heliobacterium chlorum]MBC9786718.1 hypothetical protein [Heliobacterium chlorum]
MIPMKQTVSIFKAGELDIWGKPSWGEAVSHHCRIDTTSKRSVEVNGQVVVSTAEILLKGRVAVGFGDQIEWVDELGCTYMKTPVSIAIIRDFSGKPMFTKVVI